MTKENSSGELVTRAAAITSERKSLHDLIKAAGLDQENNPSFREIIEGLMLKYPDEGGARAVFNNFGNRPHDIMDYVTDPDGLRRDRLNLKSGIKTGLHNLDAKTKGIYSGLYVVAAASSVGKTTFCLQLAGNFARSGNDVIYFAMEQSAEELASKLIAHECARCNFESRVTNDLVRFGASELDTRVEIDDAIKRLKTEIENRLNIVNIGLSCTCQFIEAYTTEYIKRNGSRPIVFIDYLQLIAPDKDFYGTTKEMMDKTVKRFKQLSMHYQIPVFLISSVNRTSYYVPLSMDSIKESGGIEYTADAIWGLQPTIMKGLVFQNPTNESFVTRKNLTEAAKKEDPRKLNLTSFKSRGSDPVWDIYFTYYPKTDTFEQAEPPEQRAQESGNAPSAQTLQRSKKRR